MPDKKLRSISISGPAHELLKAKAKAEGVTMATIVERLIAPDIGITPTITKSQKNTRWGKRS
jgi:hypothetical protein